MDALELVKVGMGCLVGVGITITLFVCILVSMYEFAADHVEAKHAMKIVVGFMLGVLAMWTAAMIYNAVIYQLLDSGG